MQPKPHHTGAAARASRAAAQSESVGAAATRRSGRLLALGRSNKQAAEDLNLSVRTTEQHHASILAKLDVDSLGELVKIAIRDRVI